MGQILRILVLVGIAYWVADYYGIKRPHGDKSGIQSAQASLPPPDQYYAVTQNDMDFVNGYLKSANEGRSFAFGTTVQNLNLPSGTQVEFTVIKTKTGWCPIRNEPLYSMSINWKKPFIKKE
jgi:hypothetical protein